MFATNRQDRRIKNSIPVRKFVLVRLIFHSLLIVHNRAFDVLQLENLDAPLFENVLVLQQLQRPLKVFND